MVGLARSPSSVRGKGVGEVQHDALYLGAEQGDDLALFVRRQLLQG